MAFFSLHNDATSSADITQTESITPNKFLGGRTLCDITLAKGFKKIKPAMESWATNTKDTFSESYIIDGKRLRIYQPLKQVEEGKDSARKYSYGGKDFKTVRVIIDSFNFNFNEVVIDYGLYPHDIFRKGNTILLRNEPVTWTGLSNTYRFIQLFDLDKRICFELFVNYYNCLPRNPLKQ